MFTSDTLRDKRILITGGAGGLGFAMAERFAELGATVALCGRTEATLKKACEKIQSDGGTALYGQADVRDYDDVQKLFDFLTAELGGLDGLVNNAAGNFYCASEDLSPGGFKAVIDIVLNGTFHCSQVFGNLLIEQQRPGSILNIVTTYTQSGSAFVLPSACAKAGVAAMTKSLAYEWATYGIRVNGIAPGPFPTAGAWERLVPDKNLEEQFKARQPLKRFGETHELADLAVFLLSDLASFMTGEIVTIDGAESLVGGQFNFLAELMPRKELKKLFQALRPKN